MSTAMNPATNPEDPASTDPGPSIDDDRTVPAAGRREVVRRQREAYGGIKFGSCFFGWLTASGATVLLTALVAAAGAGVSLAQNVTPSNAAQNSVSLIGGLVLLVIVFIGYLCGGYVAGRMARFNGVRQGIGVWLWAIVIAILLGVIGLIAGNRYDIVARTNGILRFPVNANALTVGSIVLAAALVIVSLIGAVVGGALGMRFHRRVDRVGLEAAPPAV
ncbi:MAG: hypothetical protein J2P23_11765 [Microlunatus sp.]|nr:hypothetical protein [Microlunatus sp.]